MLVSKVDRRCILSIKRTAEPVPGLWRLTVLQILSPFRREGAFMWPFSKKLTPAQEAEVQGFMKEVNRICAPCQEYYDNFVAKTSGLYAICQPALRGGYKPESPTLAADAASTREAVERYESFLTRTHAEFLTLQLAKWYPRRIRKAYDDWTLFLKGSLGFIGMVKDGLQPPDPLIHQPETGNDKLNMFVSGLGLVMVYRPRQLLATEKFENKRERPAAANGSKPLDRIQKYTLQSTILAAALYADKDISNIWPTVTGGDPISPFMVRCEMLAFMLHVMSRYAFDIGGAAARDRLHDAVSVDAIEALVGSSFDGSNAREGFDTEEWNRRMCNDVLEIVNEAETDYGDCHSFSGGKAGFLDGECVVGKVTWRASRQDNQEGNVELRLAIAKAAIEAISNSNLKRQVELCCGQVS